MKKKNQIFESSRLSTADCCAEHKTITNVAYKSGKLENMTRKKQAQSSKLSREERLVLCIGDIINELIVAQEEGKDVQLNRMKTRLSAKYGLETSPRLVDIIAAVPHEHKKTLLPKLKAKPVRTASGVST